MLLKRDRDRFQCNFGAAIPTLLTVCVSVRTWFECRLFYKDSERWAYTFQTYAFLSRMKSQMRHDLAATKAVTIFERSVISDRVCFVSGRILGSFRSSFVVCVPCSSSYLTPLPPLECAHTTIAHQRLRTATQVASCRIWNTTSTATFIPSLRAVTVGWI